MQNYSHPQGLDYKELYFIYNQQHGLPKKIQKWKKGKIVEDHNIIMPQEAHLLLGIILCGTIFHADGEYEIGKHQNLLYIKLGN